MAGRSASPYQARMATWEFHCQKCDLNFELMFSFGPVSEKNQTDQVPNCNSTRVADFTV